MHRAGRGRKMRKEIIAQPEAVTATLAAGTERIRALAQRLRNEEIKHVLLVARGTSDNAAMYARYAFSIIAHRITTMMPTSLVTLYDVPFDLSDCLVLGISQSGESPGVVEFMEAAEERGALTCALTNNPKSPIGDVVDHVLCTYAHEEESVSATKTYTTALAALHQLAALWAGDTRRAQGIYDVPKWMGEVLKMEDEIERHAERYRYMETCTVMARGLSFCSALETALKLAQCCQVFPTSYPGADFLHGPIAGIVPGHPCFVYAPEGKSMQSMNELLTALEERKAETIVVSNSGPMLARASIPVRLPAMPEEFAPMVEIVAGQLMALHLSLHKGMDPDAPPGVSKVTLTL